MANFRAVYSVGSSIASFLKQSYPAELKAHFPCDFKLISSGEIATEVEHVIDQTVTIFLHRLTLNEQVRSVTRLPDRPTVQPRVFLDLHYLVTYWGTSAEAEQTILSWVMQQLTANPVLDSSMLSSLANWRADETIQLVPTNLSLEDVLRIWDALGPKYRLSISYLARVVQIEAEVPAGAPVVATRFQLTQPESSP